MTKCYAEVDGNRYLLYCEGHAGDIEACNYITGCVYAFAGYAHVAQEEGRAEILSFSTNKEHGSFILNCIGDDGVKASFETALIGLQQLERERPTAIQIEFPYESEKED